MTMLYHYKPSLLFSIQEKEVAPWAALYRTGLINTNVMFMDRTGHIKLPIKTAVPPQLRMPEYDSGFSMTYEECCQESARELYARQEKLDVPIRLLYSGGIDSSLILASLIKELGQQQAERRVQIVMSMESIEENPWMWENVLRRSKFKIINGDNHVNDWNSDRILVGGEGNDQLLGSEIYKRIIDTHGNILNEPWTESAMLDYYRSRGLTDQEAELWVGIFAEHIRRAPCAIDTVADWWWWINLTCKWTSVYFRIITFARENSSITQDYVDKYYCQFYNNDNFQKWSMVDRYNKHKGTWDSYKFHSKDLVADFLGNNEYRSKLKRGSLWKLLAYKKGTVCVDDAYKFYYNANANDWYEPDNIFKGRL